VGKKTVHHLDYDALIGVNKAVVALTKERHAFADADGEKLQALIKEVEARADNRTPEEAIPDKASLLVFKIASGQYFHAGNKRTALVAGAAFLKKNGYSLDLRDPGLVSAVDKVGMGAASLDELFAVMGGAESKSKADRKGWEGLVESLVDANREFLSLLAS
jgi:prophage maintenance system killer protein